VKRPAGAVLIAACTIALHAQADLPPPFPRTNAALLLENERIRVWDIVWPKGQPTELHRHIYDQVGTYYHPGGRVIRTPDGNSRTTDTAVGALSTTRKGTTHIEEGNTDPPLRAVFIEMKRDTASGLAAADASAGGTTPLAGAKQLLDDERVTVWDTEWTGGPQGPRYRAARETVIVWLGSGTVRVTGDGGPASIEVEPGTVRHLARGAPAMLEVTSGAPRAMFFVFK
jgi:hypothetical protein